MKKKTFILTLMMLLCTIAFGQNYYWPKPTGFENNANITGVIKINSVQVSDARYELGAFCGDELRGRNLLSGTRYYLTVYGAGGDIINFKLYDHVAGKILDLDCITNVTFVVNKNYGEYSNPFVIEFQESVAQIGTAKFPTLEAAVEAVQTGETVTILKDINLSETLTIAAEKNFTIDLNGNDITADLDIYGNLIVIGEGNLNAGVNLAKETATLTAVQGLNVTTNVNAYSVVYENGVYKLVEIVYVAQVGTTKYETIQAAVNAATAGQTVTIIANVSGEAVEANKNITITDNGELVLNNVSINAVDGASSLTVSNLSFTGNSWINSGAASELVVSGVTADVTPSNASYTNSRSAFISLGRSEQKTLELTVENSSIIARGGSDAILGWAAITEANLTGNTFGSASAYQTNSDCVKFMAIANNAVLNITNNNVYSNYNGIVFGQNTTRDNAYTANVSGNNFYGGADHIWIEVSGSNTCHATINATSSNKVNGNAFTANDIKVHPNLNTWTSYGGVDVVFDSNNKIIGGTFKYIADNVIAEGYEKSANTDDTYSIVKSISGKIAYRAYINDIEAREAVQVDLLNIIAKQSVVVKLYDANSNVLTTTSLKAGAAEAEGLTCNIVLWGNPSSSWETTKHTALTVANVPAKIELWIDGTLKDTFENALGAGTNVDVTAKYLALDCVYKEAKINNTYYATLQAAIAAAQTGETIVLLADVTLANAIDITGKTIDLNGKNLKGNVIGTIRTNGGLYTTAENFKMIGVGADYYKTTDATVVIANAAITIASGTVELAQSWNTLENQTLTVAEDATFVVPSSMTFELNGTAIVSGTLTVNGQIILANKNATLKAVDGLNVATNIADYKVVYADGTYKVVAKVYVAQVGSTKYETFAEAMAAAQTGETIVLLADITLANAIDITGKTIDLNGKTVKADIIGTVKTNGGLWITSTGHKMLGLGADIYSTENATVVNNANEVNIVSGAITLATTEWWTLQNQNLTIGSDATFTIPATSKFNVMNGTTVMVNGTAINNGSLAIYGTAIVNGTLTVNGTVELAALEATLKAQEGLNVVTNIADYKVVYADGKYQVVAKVYVAQVGSTKYETFAEAIAAAQTGETIVLLADVTLANAIDITGKTLDLNGKTVKADIIGTVKTNGGLWITSTGHKMLGSGADIYATENATVINSANEVNIVSGAITLAATEWWTLQGQNLTIAENATFTIPATSKFNVMNGTTVTVKGAAINNGTLVIYGTAIVNGTFTATGTVELADVNATLKAQAGLNVITNIADHKVVYADGMYKVVAKVYVAQVGSTKYEILSEAVNAAQSGQTITVLKDITLAETLTIAAEKNFTIDLNGKAINAGFQQKSTDKHIYAFDNKGTLTLANGTINARGIYNYGTLTVNANATINSIDANGGYGVGNYGTLNVYGTIATTTEDNDAPTTGNYDATPIVNEVGATINVYEGSKITNVSNFTYALINNGTALIKGGTITSAHTAVGNSGTMTIEGGSFVCDGAEGVTSHAFIAEAGTTTIKGGNFDGKDNYNGFNVCASEGATVKIEGGNFLSCHSGSLYGNGTIEVSGGKFFDAVPENRCAAGYIPTQFADGTYGVKAGSYIAQIGTTKYETFEEAYAAAQAGDVIELFRTVVLTSNYNYEKQVTVKSAFGETAFRVKAEVSFNNMTINSDDYCVIVGASDGAGKLTINGGTYNGETTAVSVTKGEVNINGGTFKVEPYQGSYEYTINCIDANYNNKTAKVAIQGGKFYKFNPMNNAAEGTGTNFCAEGYEARYNQNDDTYFVRRKPSGHVAYRADVTDKTDREGIAILLKEVFAIESLVVKVYNGETLMFTSTRREQDLDDEKNVLFPVDGNTTANIVLWGKESGSWINEIHVAPTELNVPNKIEVYADGVLVDTYTHESGTVLGTNLEKYIALECVKKAVAKIGETKYMTLAEAVTAAQTGETITVLANVETTNVTLPENVTLDLNGKTVKADIIGKINTNGGLWTTPQGYKMIGNGADYYQTTDAAIVMGANYSIEMLSGTVSLVPSEWYTLDGQNITIKQGATFNISAGQTFVINGSTVENNGIVNNAGTIQILAGTVKGNIAGNLHFKGGNYITADNHNMVGTTSEYHYNATDALVNIATNGDITIAAGAMTLGHDWRTLPGQTVTVAEGATFTVPSGMTYQIYGTAIVNGTLTVNGTVELAVLEATLKAQSGLNVITNIANHAVAYENGTYKVVKAIYEQNQTLDNEWNWFSSYINIDGEDGLEMIQDELATNAILIKNDNYYVEYSSNYNMWFGNLETVSVKEMYMIKTSAATQIQLSGELADPTTAITLNKSSWSWIGYPIAHSMALNAALSNLEATHGDQIKSNNNGYASYYEGSGWYGTLNTLVPGQGYMYYSKNAKDVALVYSTSSSRGELKDNVTAKDNYWTPRSSAFANNMTITAVLNVDGVEMGDNYEVAAFANGEVRGSARPIYVDAIDRYVLFLTVHGEGDEELTFKYIDLDTNEEHSLSNVVTYSNDAILGSLSEPMVLVCGTMGIGENAANTLSIYPNPTTTNTAISFETAYDMVEVFNSLGVKVAEYRNVDSIDGIEAAGVYVIRVTNDSTVQNCRLIVK